MRVGCRSNLIRYLNRDQHIHSHIVSPVVKLTGNAFHELRTRKNYWYSSQNYETMLYARFVNAECKLTIRWDQTNLLYVCNELKQHYRIHYDKNVICSAWAHINDVSIAIDKGCAQAFHDFPTSMHTKAVEYVNKSQGTFRVSHCDLFGRCDNYETVHISINVTHKNHVAGWIIYHLYKLCM